LKLNTCIEHRTADTIGKEVHVYIPCTTS